MRFKPIPVDNPHLLVVLDGEVKRYCDALAPIMRARKAAAESLVRLQLGRVEGLAGRFDDYMEAERTLGSMARGSILSLPLCDAVFDYVDWPFEWAGGGHCRDAPDGFLEGLESWAGHVERAWHVCPIGYPTRRAWYRDLAGLLDDRRDLGAKGRELFTLATAADYLVDLHFAGLDCREGDDPPEPRTLLHLFQSLGRDLTRALESTAPPPSMPDPDDGPAPEDPAMDALIRLATGTIPGQKLVIEFLKFMKGREVASLIALKVAIYGDPKAPDERVRTLKLRVNEFLSIEAKSTLEFLIRGGRVVRKQPDR